MKEVILLLGSNLGNPERNIYSALSKLEKDVGKIVKKSKILKTLPVEFDSSFIFCNIAVVLQTKYSPIRLLEMIKSIEVEMGRKEDSKVYGEYKDRTIDIDIVSYEGVIFHSEKLDLPHHKHLYQRDFSRELLIDLNFNIN